MFKENIKYDVEYRIQHKNGEWIWLHDTASMAFEEDGAQFAHGSFSDITKRKKAEEKVRESEAQYRVLSDNAFEGIVITEKGKVRSYRKVELIVIRNRLEC